MSKPNDYEPTMMENAAYDVLQPLLAQLGIASVLFANQDTSEFNPPYATISVDNVVTQGQDDTAELSDDGIYRMAGLRTGTVTVLVVAPRAADLASGLVNYTRGKNAHYSMQRAGMIMHTAQAVDAGPIEIDGIGWQPAAVVDLQFRTTMTFNDDVGIIDLAEIANHIGAERITTYVSLLPPNPGAPVQYVGLGEIVNTPAPAMVPRPHLHLFPRGAVYESVTWSSSDYSVIDFSTEPHALKLGKSGKATITVTIKNHDGSTTSDSMEYTVR